MLLLESLFVLFLLLYFDLKHQPLYACSWFAPVMLNGLKMKSFERIFISIS